MIQERGRTSRAVRGAVVGLAAGILALGSAAPASAAVGGEKVGDPNVGVASDGSTTQTMNTLSGLQGVSGYQGTGSPALDGSIQGSGKMIEDSKAAQSGVGTQSVIAPDGRVQVTPATTYPFRANVFMSRTTDGVNHSRWCTGWLYAPDIVATAGHCVHDGGGGAWVPIGELRIWPGRDGASAPYGSCTARRLHSVVGWTTNGDERYDYGAIKLNCTVGNTVGWYGMWWQSASLTGLSTTISGYPTDKPFGTQWRHSDSVRVTQDRQIFYQNDTFNGQSGSAVYQNRASGSSFCVGFCSMGIHAYGLHGSAPHSTNNHGTRIVEPVFNNLITWRDTP